MDLDTRAKLLLAATDQLHEALCCVDRSGLHVYANDAARRLFLAPEAPAWESSLGEDFRLAEAWSRAVHLIDASTDQHAPLERLPLWRALHGEAVRDELWRLEPPGRDAVTLLVRAHPVHDADGSLLGAIAMFHDATDGVERERALRTSKWLQASILDHIPFPTWLKGKDGRYAAVNRALCELGGMDEAAMLGRLDTELWPEAEARVFQASDVLVLSSGEPTAELQHITTAEGHQVIAEVTKRPLTDHAGTLLGTIGLARDVTRQRRAEQLLLESNEALERRVVERTRELERAQALLVRHERLAALGELAGGVAHQMRNPLSAITSASYVLRRHVAAEGNVDAQLALDIILEEARHANDIITGLLDYARTRAPIARSHAVAPLATQALRKARGGENVQVELQIAPQLSVTVDAEQVSSALINLIENAFEAMSGGGTLTVSAVERWETETLGGQATTTAHANAPGEGDGSARVVELELHDTGPGVPADRVFELFSPLVTTKPLGLGLGLVTARTLLERQGASLEYVPPAPGEVGARFRVRLPVHEPSSNAPQPNSVPPTTSG